ncbi:LOW QUALITY PROTEIN: uncharacterized protein LOC112562466 [Pomacea canaliculata]|uniref:LOW QUALITY PROTEIN: uncharacterized protein LOC112562466 n=1 Tax=Pomacea canaliculata TaxID=400727 RepID=UPI000D72AD88|nr:LOW QUALITY PROTEIN: uncharacterized protein LOC112562466 [Pomacea canaliculata]
MDLRYIHRLCPLKRSIPFVSEACTVNLCQCAVMTHTTITNPPTVLDDDLQRIVHEILRSASDSDDFDDDDDSSDLPTNQGKLSTGLRKKLLQSLSTALQTERNHWKDKLHATLQEMDRQRRDYVTLQAALHDLATACGIRTTHTPEVDDTTSSCSTTDLLTELHDYVQRMQMVEEKATKNDFLKSRLQILQGSLAQMESDKSEHQSQLKKKTKEILWLQKELNSIKQQLQKLRQVVLSYNESHSTKFHLYDVNAPTDKELSRRALTRETTYTEGDQPLDYVPFGGDVAVRKPRGQHNKFFPAKTIGNKGISQCLRCQQLFKPNENNHLACRYHKKGREIKEQYDLTGRLCKVFYKWACCKQGLNIQGCSYGYHV